MKEWKTYTVGEVCETISETYRRNDNEVVLVNTSDVLEGNILNHQLVENKNLKGQFKKTFIKEDILYSEIRQIKDMRLWILITQKIILHQLS